MRFDANMTPHANLVYRDCSRIENVEFVPEHLATVLQHLAQAAAWRRMASASTSTASAGAAPAPASANPTVTIAASRPISLRSRHVITSADDVYLRSGG